MDVEFVLWYRIPARDSSAELYESMIVDKIEFHPIEIRYVTDVDLESATWLGGAMKSSLRVTQVAIRR